MSSDWSHIPLPEAVMFGINPGWSPEKEDLPKPGEACKICGARKGRKGRMEGGKIADGSRLYCAACRRTGFEAQLEMALLEPDPETPDA